MYYIESEICIGGHFLEDYFIAIPNKLRRCLYGQKTSRLSEISSYERILLKNQNLFI